MDPEGLTWHRVIAQTRRFGENPANYSPGGLLPPRLSAEKHLRVQSTVSPCGGQGEGDPGPRFPPPGTLNGLSSAPLCAVSGPWEGSDLQHPVLSPLLALKEPDGP